MEMCVMNTHETAIEGHGETLRSTGALVVAMLKELEI